MKVKRVDDSVFEVEFTIEEKEAWEYVAKKLNISITLLVFGLLACGLKYVYGLMKGKG